MTTNPAATRVVEIAVTCNGVKLRMYWNRWEHKGSSRRDKSKTRVILATLPLPPSDDDLTRYAMAFAYHMVDPQKRHIRAPEALRWQEVATGDDRTSPHGADVDGRGWSQPELPLDGGLTERANRSTILSGLAPKGQPRAKRAPASAREPVTRNLSTRRTEQVDGA